METLFWILIIFGGSIIAFLQTASPVIVGILVAGGCFAFFAVEASKIAQSFLKVQKQQLETEKERLLLEQQKVEAILKLDGVDQAKVWETLEKDS